jgi:HipA-like protein
MSLENNLSQVDVYAEYGKSRIYVGRLSKKDEGYEFIYDWKYLNNSKAVPLGYELPLTQREFFSEELFGTFKDRIPSRKNPAYVEYCEKFGISSEEKDPFKLLVTIGRKGPSSFIFEAVLKSEFSGDDVADFRNELGLSTRDFALLFDVSYSTLNKIENNRVSGRDILKRLEIYVKFKEVAIFEINKNRVKVHSSVYNKVRKLIEK